MISNIMNSTTAVKPAVMTSRMPHVFVIPPEEEQQETPPWCCFDADKANDSADCSPASRHDIHLFNVPYTSQPLQTSAGSPSICVPVAGPPRTKPVTSKKLEKKQRPEAVKIVEKVVERGGCRDVREDSDVIEVVKVKRGKDDLTDPEEHSKMKRTKTLKARATRAFQSIKNVGKGSRKQRIKDLWTSSEGVPGAFKGMQEHIRHQEGQLQQSPPVMSPSLSLSNSRSLSQIFQSAKPPQPSSAIASGTVVLQFLKTLNQNLPPLSQPLPNRLTKNKRFSVRELHKVFAFPSSSPGSRTIHTTDSPDPAASTQRFCSFHGHIHDQKSAAMHHRPAIIDDEDDYGTLLPGRPRDLSFEMRLDSLHFDSLSFDPEEFNISIDGSRRR
ncbi:hypothetical protein EDD16DRAFT_1525447 [Pisolithus croceorrhizus]|nr:hypothetical protein EDD16DRAFT_1525447 [Pisolithus croceorrhizus]